MGGARMGRRGTCIDYSWDNQKERDNDEDQDIGGWIIRVLRWILDRQDGVVWNGLSGSGQGQVESSCECSNEPSGSIKCWKTI
jgi:hypothetical protein